MSNRKESFAVGEYYHIYNRGSNKQIIFVDDEDKDRFLKLLYLCNSNKSINFREDIVENKIDAWDFDRGDPIVSIGAMVLMPNHFHLYITVSQRCNLGGNISLFIKKLCTAYSMYFNKRYSRTGGLFEGTFKSNRVISDQYARYLFSYIHLNPVKLIDSLWKENGIQDHKKTLLFLDQYPWSSYHYYRGKSKLENKILSPNDFPGYFTDPNIFDTEIFDWLAFRDE